MMDWLLAAVMVINTQTGLLTWDGSSTTRFEVQVSNGATMTVTGPSARIAPPDREMKQRIRARVRPAGSSTWSEWSDEAGGVPLGYDPDADQNGIIFPPDYRIFLRAYQEGWIWPDRIEGPFEVQPAQ